MPVTSLTCPVTRSASGINALMKADFPTPRYFSTVSMSGENLAQFVKIDDGLRRRVRLQATVPVSAVNARVVALNIFRNRGKIGDVSA